MILSERAGVAEIGFSNDPAVIWSKIVQNCMKGDMQRLITGAGLKIQFGSDSGVQVPSPAVLFETSRRPVI